MFSNYENILIIPINKELRGVYLLHDLVIIYDNLNYENTYVLKDKYGYAEYLSMELLDKEIKYYLRTETIKIL